MADKQLEGLFHATLGGLKNMADVNTVIGDPIITADGTTVIPYSRVSFGYGVGGAEDDAGEGKAAGGSGGGVTVTPVGFLIVSPDGETKMINVDSQNAAEKLIDCLPDVIDSIAEFFRR